MARPQWKSTLSGMARRSLTLFGPASFADVDGYVGTWVINTGKSHFDPGPLKKSETLIVTDAHVLDAETFGDGTSCRVASRNFVTQCLLKDVTDLRPVAAGRLP
jgi:hypothetical protein